MFFWKKKHTDNNSLFLPLPHALILLPVSFSVPFCRCSVQLLIVVNKNEIPHYIPTTSTRYIFRSYIPHNDVLLLLTLRPVRSATAYTSVSESSMESSYEWFAKKKKVQRSGKIKWKNKKRRNSSSSNSRQQDGASSSFASQELDVLFSNKISIDI